MTDYHDKKTKEKLKHKKPGQPKKLAWPGKMIQKLKKSLGSPKT